MSVEIPSILLKQIQEGNCVLFLGSGASFGAISDYKDKVPLGQTLADKIATKFLSEDYLGSPLTYVSELAISETNLLEVQNFIYELFKIYSPSDFHKLIPTFIWKAIFTTNYDTIIEQSYSSTNSLQDLSVVVRDTRQQDIFATPKSLPYYKLHGSIDNRNDESIPFILTIDQYVTHRNNRERLFDTLKELAYDYTFLFVGYSMMDSNIRGILNELNKSLSKRPRFYMLSPSFTTEEVRLWEGKKITCIKSTFKDFSLELDTKISQQNRILASFRPKVDHPIFEKFTISVSDVKPTDALMYFINEETDFIHSNFSTENTKPSAFYKGYFENWDPIAKNLDVKRQLLSSIISEVFIEEKFNNIKQNLILIKGNAGSGKSVFLKRLIWDTSIEFEKLCIYIKPGFSIKFEPVSELSNYVKDRIYYFVDGVAGRADEIKYLINKCKEDKIDITIICAERSNVWNTDCELLHSYLTQDYVLKYLHDKEIEALLVLLERHKCLGMLAKKTKEEQILALSETANRELLVALYEATEGLPFEKIISDEYDKINSEAAKSLYITICILHRLGAAARAGLIARVHNISFEDFKTKLFKPLEFIVFDKRDYSINDYVYLSRHKEIAEMVFDSVLNNQQDRYDEYARLLNYLNIDFESDKIACLAMTNARKLQKIFNDPIMIRNLYNIAEETNPDNSKIKQQRAIYEMNSSGGSIYTAERLLKDALQISPNDPVILHSFAELYYKKAEITTYVIEQNKLLKQSTDICNRLITKRSDTSYAYTTLLKVLLYKLKREISNDEVVAIEAIVREFEKILSKAKQENPNEASILNLEASFNELFKDTPAVKEILKRAYNINKASPFISLRYARFLSDSGEVNLAISILYETAKLNPSEKDINLNLGIYLSNHQPDNHNEIKHFLRRSFTQGDNRYFAKFWYARALYLSGESSQAKIIFEELEESRVNYELKTSISGVVTSNNLPTRFIGTIKQIETSYGFIQQENSANGLIFFKPFEYEDKYWLTKNQKVSFLLGFNYRGPVAFEILPINNGLTT